MCNGKEAGSLRMSRKAAKESNACVGAFGTGMDGCKEEKEKQMGWQVFRTTVAIATT